VPNPEGGNARSKGTLLKSFAVIGYIPYLGFSDKVGCLLLALGDKDGVLHFAGALRWGFSGSRRIALATLLDKDRVTALSIVDAPQLGVEHWVHPRHMAEVKFSGWDRSGYPRYATFVRLW
jgi:ATP-dependent DNA ligase